MFGSKCVRVFARLAFSLHGIAPLCRHHSAARPRQARGLDRAVQDRPSSGVAVWLQDAGSSGPVVGQDVAKESWGVEEEDRGALWASPGVGGLVLRGSNVFGPEDIW